MTTQFRADLHCHSTCSDGTVTPKKLIDLAIENNLSGLSITDHDTLNAYEIALPYAKEKAFPLLPGVEFSCIQRGESVHILGYAFNLNNEEINEFCIKHKSRREQRSLLILEKLKEHGMPINLNTESLESIGRPHIAAELIKNGYVQTMEEAFRRYLGEECPCYVPGDAFSVEETIEVIHQAGGVAVIAHPHLIHHSRIVTDLLKMPFDGIEAYYARFAPHKEKAWVKIGLHREWILTGGSDYHGTVKPHIPLGCSWVNDKTFHPLYEKWLTNNC